MQEQLKDYEDRMNKTLNVLQDQPTCSGQD